MPGLDKKLFKGKVVFIGVGNTLKGDDGFGPLLAGAIGPEVGFRVIDSGVAPENYLGLIVKENPETLVFADTADFGGKPGEYRLLASGDIGDSSFFLTHNSSLGLLFRFLLNEGVKAGIYMLCMQPAAVVLGADPCREVLRGIEELSAWFKSNFPAQPLMDTGARL